MPSNRGGRPSASNQKLHQFMLSRGANERPLQFDGEVLAEAEATTGSGATLRAALYRTKSGQVVSEFSRRDQDSNESGNAAVFDTLDEGLAWFRPGKLTTSLLKKLGRWDAEVLHESAATGAIKMSSADEIEILLLSPNETLTVEYKSWLDIGDTPGRACLAKAAIALANSGGGIVVLGMREASDGEFGSIDRPQEIDRYTQDDVNQAINRFAEPQFHCKLEFAIHPESGVEHAIVYVPPGRVPIMSRRDSEGTIAARKYYIRKPGPRSEEPTTGQEWQDLINRCVAAGREYMLESIRSILQGSAGVSAAPKADVAALNRFTDSAKNRWGKLVETLPLGDGARFEHGHYELAFEIQGVDPLESLAKMRNAMAEASMVKHTGWGPFIQMTRPEYAPQNVGGAIEVWLGKPAERLLGRAPSHCDFWRADAAGRLFLMRGYDEDSARDANREPGKWTDVTLPIWRVGEAILYVARLAELISPGLSFIARCRYYGLEGRILTSFSEHRFLGEEYQCRDNDVVLEDRLITPIQARDNLAEVLHPLLLPLYERYSFFPLSRKMVAEEAKRLVSGRF